MLAGKPNSSEGGGSRTLPKVPERGRRGVSGGGGSNGEVRGVRGRGGVRGGGGVRVKPNTSEGTRLVAPFSLSPVSRTLPEIPEDCSSSLLDLTTQGLLKFLFKIKTFSFFFLIKKKHVGYL